MKRRVEAVELAAKEAIQQKKDVEIAAQVRIEAAEAKAKKAMEQKKDAKMAAQARIKAAEAKAEKAVQERKAAEERPNFAKKLAKEANHTLQRIGYVREIFAERHMFCSVLGPCRQQIQPC